MPKTYPLTVDGWGAFEIHRITMGLNMKIALEVERYSEGETRVSSMFSILANAMAHAKVLVAKAPDGWALDGLDPLDPVTYDRLIDLYEQIRSQEQFFRKAPGGDGPPAGEGSGGVGGAVVSPDIQSVPD